MDAVALRFENGLLTGVLLKLKAVLGAVNEKGFALVSLLSLLAEELPNGGKDWLVWFGATVFDC